MEGEQQMRESLRIPTALSFVGVIGLGYRAASDRPAGSETTRPRRTLDQVLHNQQW